MIIADILGGRKLLIPLVSARDWNARPLRPKQHANTSLAFGQWVRTGPHSQANCGYLRLIQTFIV